MGDMESSNPALNDKIFKREIANSRGGSSAWGTPADEVPPDLFGGRSPQRGASTLPPPPSAPPHQGDGRPTWQEPTAAPPLDYSSGETMRLGGTLSAAGILLGFVLVASYFGWQSVSVETSTNLAGETVVDQMDFPGWLFPALIGGFVIGMVTVFKPKLARITGPMYAVAMGLFLGAMSKMFEVQYDGIVAQAIGLTVGVFAMMLVLYASGTIRVTDKLRKGVIAATGAVVLVYLVSIVARLFGTDVPMIHESGPVGIGFSLVVVGIASFMLLLDFDFIERGVKMGAPRYMEWYGAFGLMVTLIWLYMELLRLLAKLRN
jgi:uncharacterized YccA/Bax inhibitor family protein